MCNGVGSWLGCVLQNIESSFTIHAFHENNNGHNIEANKAFILENEHIRFDVSE